MRQEDFFEKLDKGEAQELHSFVCPRCETMFFKRDGLPCACPTCGDLCDSDRSIIIKKETVSVPIKIKSKKHVSKNLSKNRENQKRL